MHIPDGFLSTRMWAALDVAAVPVVGLLIRRTQHALDEGKLPLLGVMGAFVFAAQMINFPVGIGTSGHLVGGALLAITMGPAAAVLVMTAILTVQAFVFQDGGVLALGANLLNMAVVGVGLGYLPYRWLSTGKNRPLGIFLGGFLSLVGSALLALSELLLSGVQMPMGVVGVSLALFLISGLLEGAITLAVVQALEKLNPQYVQTPDTTTSRARAALGAAALFLAVVGVFFASASPDGLESLAEQAGIAAQAHSLWQTPLADYEAAFLQQPWMRKALAGVLGLFAVYVLCAVTGRVLLRRVPPRPYLNAVPDQE